jgi:hypothetical protein
MIGGAIIFLLAWPVVLLVSLVKLRRKASRSSPKQTNPPSVTAEEFHASL